MANFPALYRNSNGRDENLTSADGGLLITVIDCAAASEAVSLFPTVDTTGSLALFTAYNSTCTVGAASSVFTFGGGITVTQTLTATAAALFNGDVTLGNAAGDDIIVTGSVAGDLTFKTGATRTIGLDSATMVVGTTTTGQLQLVGAAEIDLATILVDINATAAVTIDAVTASQFVVSGATADLTLGARGATITLSDVSNTGLDANFTATSVLGAINEVKTSNLGTTTPGWLASEVVAVGDAVYLNRDVGNARTGVYLADNTASGKQDPVGIALTGGGIGTTIYIATHGQEAIINSVIAATNEGSPVYLDTAGGLTLTPPPNVPGSGDSSQIIGQVSATGVAGVAKIIIQLRDVKIM
ncbi:hypothetical protein LCGC14_0645880 [marine sediment metagenome]|uniref:Uncharacterized protein n=1 Tax=marine sediment metagenome TaxID=412755 RepID=A0A0F9QXT1_9ZZZZ